MMVLLCVNLGFSIAIPLLFAGQLEGENLKVLLGICPFLNMLYLVLLWGFIFIHHLGQTSFSQVL